jgi:hypothetical protein
MNAGFDAVKASLGPMCALVSLSAMELTSMQGSLGRRS